MNRNMRAALCTWVALCCSAWVQAQEKHVPNPTIAPKAKTAYYIDSAVLNVGLLLPEPPAVGSPANNAELAELHGIEEARTPEQVAKAKADDQEEDMFVYKTVFGPGFTAEALPLTAALGEHVKNEQSVAGGQLKRYYQRPRPYQTDATLHPVCGLKSVHDSYPSGHALTGYLEAFTLVELAPEKRAEILSRADEYARNREVCGVHYPSDVEASREAAYVVFGYMLSTSKFQHDLAAAREEMRAKLELERK
jgi:acid phosphatase (class A)